jgi:hypothetical protein
MSKKMCKTKNNDTKLKVKNPKYECKVCHELAAKEKHLCKSKKL